MQRGLWFGQLRSHEFGDATKGNSSWFEVMSWTFGENPLLLLYEHCNQGAGVNQETGFCFSRFNWFDPT